MQGGIIPPCMPDSHSYTMTKTRCRIGTVISPDDRHIFARKMYRRAINILVLRKNCALVWFYLQEKVLKETDALGK
jgi:hypothetical protein